MKGIKKIFLLGVSIMIMMFVFNSKNDVPAAYNDIYFYAAGATSAAIIKFIHKNFLSRV